MKELIVMKRIALKATPPVVWDALTNPEKTKEYFFNCEVFSDWEVGSTITFKGRMFFFKKIEMTGEILEIVPEKLLKYTLNNSDDDDESANFSTVTDELTYQNGETILTIMDNVGQGEGVEDRYKKSVEGWDNILKGLKELVEE
ncbi:SRPBCC domain-containing protein [Runella sp.]|uniref:SRPBCC domain-containing protein n=1 Tax=Runella sp. TaxID=1960881 RepID=UPI003D12811B